MQEKQRRLQDGKSTFQERIETCKAWADEEEVDGILRMIWESFDVDRNTYSRFSSIILEFLGKDRKSNSDVKNAKTPGIAQKFKVYNGYTQYIHWIYVVYTLCICGIYMVYSEYIQCIC